MSQRWLPARPPESLSPEAAQLYRTIVEGPRGTAVVMEDGELLGAFSALLSSPNVGDALQALGLAVQGSASLPASIRESVIVLVAARTSCRLEGRVHASRAKDAGVIAASIDQLAAGSIPDVDDAQFMAALQLAAAQLDGRLELTDLPGGWRDQLSEAQMVDVIVLTRYYQTMCAIIALFGLDG